MQIEYLGHASFLITTENGIKIVTDPYQGVGYELPSDLQADIVTVSHGHFDHNYTAAVKGKPMLIDCVGKQRAGGIDFYGEHTFHDPKQGKLRGDNVVFSFTVDGIRSCHLGDLGEAYNEEIVKKIGSVDVLFIPIGGTYTIDAKQAKAYIEAIAPKIAIPMHYRPIDGCLDIASADGFLRLFNGSRWCRPWCR